MQLVGCFWACYTKSMSGNEFVSIVASSNEPAQVEHKTGKIWVILTIVELVVIGILAFLLATTKVDSTREISDEEATRGIADLDERKTLIVDNSDAFIAAWSANKNELSLSKTNCNEIVKSSVEYGKNYSVQALDASICDASAVSVKTEVAKSEYYPFSEMRYLSIGNDQVCAKFELYPSFDLINSYSFIQGSCVGTNNIPIINK